MANDIHFTIRFVHLREKVVDIVPNSVSVQRRED